MYTFIVLYLLLLIVKIYFDIQNGFKLDEYYRSGCDLNGPNRHVEPKNCEADLNDIREDETQRKVPQILFGTFKIIFDLSIVVVGVYFFYKLCSYYP